MLYYIIKVVISAVLIVAVSELSKRSSLMGGIFASVPLVSVLAMIWLYVETQDVEKISRFSTSVFWMVIPSLSMFILLPIFIRLKMGFYPSLIISIFVMIVFYYLMVYILGKFGVNL